MEHYVHRCICTLTSAWHRNQHYAPAKRHANRWKRALVCDTCRLLHFKRMILLTSFNFQYTQIFLTGIVHPRMMIFKSCIHSCVIANPRFCSPMKPNKLFSMQHLIDGDLYGEAPCKYHKTSPHNFGSHILNLCKKFKFSNLSYSLIFFYLAFCVLI